MASSSGNRVVAIGVCGQCQTDASGGGSPTLCSKTNSACVQGSCESNEICCLTGECATSNANCLI